MKADVLRIRFQALEKEDDNGSSTLLYLGTLLYKSWAKIRD